MKYLQYITAALTLLIGTCVIAAEAPPLPSAAKKLSIKEIVAQLDGRTVRYTSYTHADVWKGKTTFDFKKKKFWGTYPDKGVSKKYKPMDLGIAADGYCYESECRKGLSIYKDGSKLYEVDPQGKVTAVLTK